MGSPRIKVGDKFTLKCGTEVTVVKRKAERYEVVNSEGEVYIISRHRLIKGSGIFGKKTRVLLGDRFLLNCGVEVTVTEIVKYPTVLCEDDFGNTKKVNDAYSLISGQVSWKFSGISVRRMRSAEQLNQEIKESIRAGNRYSSTCFGDFKVISYDPITDSYSIIWDDTSQQQDNISADKISKGSVRNSSLTSSPTILDYNPKGYYVYIAKDSNDKVFYIGVGKEDRYKHVTSGVSHNFGLNKYYFENVNRLEVIIVKDGMSKKDADILEKFMIKRDRPIFNARG